VPKEGDKQEMRPAARLTTVDCLRGVAASAVVWFHLTNGNPAFDAPAWLKASGRQGWLGVEAFFVISGFVLPYALHAARYRLHGYGSFLLRRIIRLDPPYFASIVVAIALTYASNTVPGFRGAPPNYSVLQILSHAAYANAFFGFPSIIVVYWSLSLEFQFYLLIGLLFPLLVNRKTMVRVATLIALAAAALLVESPLLVFSWLFLFMLGILAFYYRRGMLTRPWYIGAVCLAGIGVWMRLGPATALVGLASTLLIAFVEWRSAPLLFLGDISYSLYLIHVPIAGRVINAAARFSLDPAAATLVVVLAFIVAIVSAYGFHRLIERPARAWAATITYGDRQPHAPSDPPATEAALQIG
jgi:peptidoglycan/LPS O-acetylase OafA/YrhL